MRGLARLGVALAVAGAGASVPATSALATEYAFTVTCEHRSHVVIWRTGDIDPGREWLRVATGTQNPNCSVGAYSPSRDADLETEIISAEAGVARGVPLLGTLVCWAFGC